MVVLLRRTPSKSEWMALRTVVFPQFLSIFSSSEQILCTTTARSMNCSTHNQQQMLSDEEKHDEFYTTGFFGSRIG